MDIIQRDAAKLYAFKKKIHFDLLFIWAYVH